LAWLALRHEQSRLACATTVLREAAEGLMPMIDPDDLGAWEDEILSLIRTPKRLTVLRAIAVTYCEPVAGILTRAVADAAAKLLHSDGLH